MQIRTKVIYRGNKRNFLWNAWLDKDTSKCWLERIKSYTMNSYTPRYPSYDSKN